MKETQKPVEVQAKAKTAAQRKADEAKRKKLQGLKRRSYWLSGQAIKLIEDYKADQALKTNDQALNEMLFKLKK